MNEAQKRAWLALDIGPVWHPRQVDEVDPAEKSESGAPAEAGLEQCGSGSAAQPGRDDVESRREQIAAYDWPALQRAVASCRACRLCESRSKTVFGVGDADADWFVVGEAPGAEEDRRGEPFVGRAGQLLDAMLAAVTKSRTSGVFIANVLKCRPPENRDPTPDEAARCEPFLQRQLELVSPKLILVLGKVAAQSLLGTEASIASLRGRVHRYQVGDREIPMIVTYHPAYLLRAPLEKAKAWADLQLAIRTARGA